MLHNEPVTAFVGLGGNVGDSRVSLKTAIADIDRLPRTRVHRRSSFYRSPPMGTVSQPSFVNAVVRVETRLRPRELLAELQKIERRHGRVRKLHWGPRTLDLDLLVYGDLSVNEPGLVIPHPGIPSRSFVLYPLMEITPNVHIPGMGTPLTLIRRCAGPRPIRLPGRARD